MGKYYRMSDPDKGGGVIDPENINLPLICHCKTDWPQVNVPDQPGVCSDSHLEWRRFNTGAWNSQP